MSILSLLLIVASFAQIGWAQMWQLGECLNIDPFKNINLEKYQGTWYEVEKFMFMPELVGSCVSVKYTPQDDGTLTTKINFKESLTGTPTNWQGTTYFLDPDTKEGKTGNMQLTLSVRNPTAIPMVPMSQTYLYRVIDTDYDNFLIKYSCVSYFGMFQSTTLWVLTRDKTYPENVKKLVRDSLHKKSINPMWLLRTPCPNNDY